MGKVKKKMNIHFVAYGTQFDECKFFGGDEGPEHKHFLSNTISRAEFVSNIGKLRTKLEISCGLQFWWYL